MLESAGSVADRVLTDIRCESWKNRGCIYVPKGRAREYANYAVSLYRGCEHGCVYCFAPGQLRMKREEFMRVSPREDILLKLEKDASRLSKIDPDAKVLMSFTTDPYPSIEAEKNLTRNGISLLTKAGVKVVILTKSGEIVRKDFDLLSMHNCEFATTLTHVSDAFNHWEPNAAPPEVRIENLKIAKGKGIKTWASIEPVFDADQAIKVIDASFRWVDEFRIGPLNHHPATKDVNWLKFVSDVTDVLDKKGVPYTFKKDMLDRVKESIPSQ